MPKPAMAAQKMVAARFDIPMNQLYTISLAKFTGYIKWYWSAEGRAERALDAIQDSQMKRWQREWM